MIGVIASLVYAITYKTGKFREVCLRIEFLKRHGLLGAVAQISVSAGVGSDDELDKLVFESYIAVDFGFCLPHLLRKKPKTWPSRNKTSPSFYPNPLNIGGGARTMLPPRPAPKSPEATPAH